MVVCMSKELTGLIFAFPCLLPPVLIFFLVLIKLLFVVIFVNTTFSTEFNCEARKFVSRQCICKCSAPFKFHLYAIFNGLDTRIIVLFVVRTDIVEYWELFSRFSDSAKIFELKLVSR